LLQLSAKVIARNDGRTFGRMLRVRAGGDALGCAECAAFKTVFSTFIKRIPGAAWNTTQETASEFSMPELAED